MRKSIYTILAAINLSEHNKHLYNSTTMVGLGFDN